MAWLEQGNQARAVQEFDEVIARQRLMMGIDDFSLRGAAYLHKGDHARALQDLDQAVQRAPEDIRALTARGNAWLVMGQPRKALADYQTALQLAPDFKEARVGKQRAQNALPSEQGPSMP